MCCSIDPLGCEDVDDALGVRQLPNGNTELSVHIADVSYFVPAGSFTDAEARSRGTTGGVMFVCLFVCVDVCVSACLCVSVCGRVCVDVSVSVWRCVRLSVSLSACLPISLCQCSVLTPSPPGCVPRCCSLSCE